MHGPSGHAYLSRKTGCSTPPLHTTRQSHTHTSMHTHTHAQMTHTHSTLLWPEVTRREKHTLLWKPKTTHVHPPCPTPRPRRRPNFQKNTVLSSK